MKSLSHDSLAPVARQVSMTVSATRTFPLDVPTWVPPSPFLVFKSQRRRCSGTSRTSSRTSRTSRKSGTATHQTGISNARPAWQSSQKWLNVPSTSLTVEILRHSLLMHRGTPSSLPSTLPPFHPSFKLLYMIQWQKPALRCVSEAEGLADWSSKRFQVTAEHDSLTESLLHSFISPARVFRPVDAHDEDLPTPELCNLPPGYTLPCRSHLQAMERWHERPYIHTPPGLHASMD